MKLRMFLAFLVLPALISACSSQSPLPAESGSSEECAGPVIEDGKDGGVGGTGNAPPPCDAPPGLE